MKKIMKFMVLAILAITQVCGYPEHPKNLHFSDKEKATI